MAKNPLEQFEIHPIVEFPAVAGMDFSFTNQSLWLLIVMGLSILLFTAGTRKHALVPGRIQMLSEMFYEFVATMVNDTIGPKGRIYFPFVFTLFVVVLFGNLLGMLPMSFTITSHIVVTAALAVFVLLAVIVMGVMHHGLKFFSIFMPNGVPLFIAPLIIPIEVFSFLIRPVTLSVRLFANMMAGHVLIKVIAGFAVSMGVLGIIPMGFNVLIIGFEILVALLQAYIFTILSCIYLKDSVELH